MTNAVNIAQGGTNNVSWRNRIINGAMVIDQRNAGASVTPASTAYGLDRWRLTVTQASKLSMQQNQGSVTPPAGYSNYLGVTSQSAYSVASTDYFTIMQRIEGYNISDLGWGASGAVPITLSFWVRSSLTGTFGASLGNSDANRTYPFTYTINSANTWEQKSVTIAGDTSGTWLTNNGVGISLNFSLGAGSTYTGAAGNWQSANYWGGATGQTSVVGTNGATFYITGVQLEKGTSASPFEYRDYGRELMMCQRYTYVFNGTTSNSNFGIGRWEGNNVLCQMIFPVVMRTVPTITAPVTSGLQAVDPTVAWYNISALSSVHKNGVLSADLYFTVSGASVANKTFAQVAVNSGTPQVIASAEL